MKTFSFIPKKMFFDRAKVMRAMDRASLKNLSQAGAHIRQTAKTSMRKRKKASNPGSPPSVHRGDLKKLLFFAFDPGRRTVVIGPMALNRYHVAADGALRQGLVPQVMEYGGKLGIREKQLFNRKWVGIGRRKPRPGQATRVRTATYPARPFMAPALAKEIPNLAKRWANSIKVA